jgi:hypothetical protein
MAATFRISGERAAGCFFGMYQRQTQRCGRTSALALEQT